MKLASIFFTESESIFMIYHKDTYKRARNMKLASIFFTVSESIFENLLKECTTERLSNTAQQRRVGF